MSALRRLKHQMMFSRPRARIAMVLVPAGYGTSGLLRARCLPWTRASLMGQGDKAVKGRPRKTRSTGQDMLDTRHPHGGVLGPRDPRC
jgi:hypothetical protein